MLRFHRPNTVDDSLLERSRNRTQPYLTHLDARKKLGLVLIEPAGDLVKCPKFGDVGLYGVRERASFTSTKHLISTPQHEQQSLMLKFIRMRRLILVSLCLLVHARQGELVNPRFLFL